MIRYIIGWWISLQIFILNESPWEHTEPYVAPFTNMDEL